MSRGPRTVFRANDERSNSYPEYWTFIYNYVIITIGYMANEPTSTSYARKLVTAISGGVFDLFDAVLEFYSFNDLGKAF